MDKKVLIVDDEESILRGIKLNLGRFFSLTLANGPEEALARIQEEGPFPVIVSDMRMPGMDGATLMRNIKSQHPETLCILLTGHADFEFGGSQALQSGQLFKILNKPCPPDTLKSSITAAFETLQGGGPVDEKPPDCVL